MKRVFIDGSAGTTGLRIYDRLKRRSDIELITLPDELRKDLSSRKEMLNSADIAFLCLPDAAAKEAAELVDNGNTVIIDTSTAHRISSEWTYGFPEIDNLRGKIACSKRIANPGCHASGFIALVQPLVAAGILNDNAGLCCFSLTGYSGGGKNMISQYEADNVDKFLLAPRMYALSQEHKHIPEMMKITGIKKAPVFCPIVSNYYSGMQVTVPVFSQDLNGSITDICAVYKQTYNNTLVHFDENVSENGFMSANRFSGRDDMQITVAGNSERILLISRYDNLGKGASGSAIQNMNILLGVDETTGLNF